MEYVLYPYMKNYGIFGCPTLRPDPVRLGADNLPLNQFGSYAYAYGGIGAGCGPGAPATSPRPTPFELFVRLGPFLDSRLGYLLTTNCNPQAYFIAGQPLAAVGSSSTAILSVCNSYGAHQGFTDDDIVPVSVGGTGREETGATFAVFADGHARYKTGKFIDLVAFSLAPLNP